MFIFFQFSHLLVMMMMVMMSDEGVNRWKHNWNNSHQTRFPNLVFCQGKGHETAYMDWGNMKARRAIHSSESSFTICFIVINDVFGYLSEWGRIKQIYKWIYRWMERITQMCQTHVVTSIARDVEARSLSSSALSSSSSSLSSSSSS